MTRFIFLHGVGSTGAAMRPLAESLGVTATAHFPDGPHPFDMGQGRQWFSVKGVTEANRPDRIKAAMPEFRAVIESFGDPADSVLVGFSQGAIMALHAAAEGLPVRAVFALSGRLAGPVAAQDDWPPITLVHGAADPVIAGKMALATDGWLKAAGASPTLHLFEGLGHGVDDRVLSALSPRIKGLATGM